MKKLKLLFATALATLFVAFGVSPVVAYADEGVETPEISVEMETSEEVIEETESVENTTVETPKTEEETSEKTKLTYEDILAITGEIMEQEGFKNKWDKALYHIETAASEKNVELLIVLVLIVIILLVVYIAVKFGIWKVRHINDTTSKDVKDIKQASGQQTTAINTLIDEEEKLTNEVHNANTETTTREKALAESIEKQNVAIRCFIRGTKIEQSLKEESFRALNESNDCCDKAKK